MRAIRMDDEDIRTGIALEIEAARAQARVQAMADAAQIFKEQMCEKYNADPEKYEMYDWLAGFQPVNAKE